MIHNKRAYTDRFAEVYTGGRWVAEAAFDMGPPAPSDLQAIMRQIVEDAGEVAQKALLENDPNFASQNPMSTTQLRHALDKAHKTAAQRLGALFDI